MVRTPLWVSLLVGGAVVAHGGAPVGTTEVLKWKDGRSAALFLMFDDDMSSQKDNAVPELEKRGLKGVFYVNPDRGWFKAEHKTFWQEELPKLGHEYGIHTMTHKVTDEADAEWEITECSNILRRVNPPKGPSPLMSYARPGGKGAFQVSDDVEKRLLEKNHLIKRTSDTAIMYTGQDTDHMKRWVDGMIAKQQNGRVCFHGVGGQWLSVKMDVFVPFLDHLVANKDQLWIDGHMPIHKYDTERKTAAVSVEEAGAAGIRLKLTSAADPALYDQPLTLRTSVPADWKTCQVTQGSRQQDVKVSNGIVRYDALPGNDPINLRNAQAK